MLDILPIEAITDAAVLDDMLAELRSLGGAPATLLSSADGGIVQREVRSTTRIAVPEATRARVAQLFLSLKPQLEAHFGQPLGHCEDPQFLRYQRGDSFVPHQDGNTPLIHDRSRFRRISLVLFLSTPGAETEADTYGGGALVFHGTGTDAARRVPFNPAPGTVIAFRAETTHEVTPVTHGERYTIVSWFHTPDA